MIAFASPIRKTDTRNRQLRNTIVKQQTPTSLPSASSCHSYSANSSPQALASITSASIGNGRVEDVFAGEHTRALQSGEQHGHFRVVSGSGYQARHVRHEDSRHASSSRGRREADLLNRQVQVENNTHGPR